MHRGRRKRIIFKKNKKKQQKKPNFFLSANLNSLNWQTQRQERAPPPTGPQKSPQQAKVKITEIKIGKQWQNRKKK